MDLLLLIEPTFELSSNRAASLLPPFQVSIGAHDAALFGVVLYSVQLKDEFEAPPCFRCGGQRLVEVPSRMGVAADALPPVHAYHFVVSGIGIDDERAFGAAENLPRRFAASVRSKSVAMSFPAREVQMKPG